MARLNIPTTSSDVESDPQLSSRQNSRRISSDSSPSPAPSISSDKENRGSSAKPAPQPRKRRSTAGNMSTSESEGSNKRRRLGDRSQRSQLLPSKAALHREIDERVDKKYYDPDQDIEERRALRKGMRDLQKDFNDSRTEYLQPNSKGIRKTIKKADENFKNVKQTVDATIDSRLLVTAADLSYKKTAEIALGDSSTGVDIDEFMSKCISFMRPGAAVRRGRSTSAELSNNTQTQRHRRRPRIDEEDDDNPDLDWPAFGHTCFLTNSRPCLSGFLLGPLSVQKRTRQLTQRRAREARADPANALRPQELNAADLSRAETTNLTTICAEIYELLVRTIKINKTIVEAAVTENPDMDENATQELLCAHHLAEDGNMLFLDFVVNPRSFGQTVENMFYVSFLIKEGTVGLGFDSRGMPTLGPAGTRRSLTERQEAERNQGVLALDWGTWQGLVKECGIQKSLIPHRREETWEDGPDRDGSSGDGEEEEEEEGGGEEERV